ncbi:hypothetical protein ACH5RR_013894 [Cinchona calisaya]|uniref:Uncharacterized protein n=1 Tax=Cinchona calisaya TaxID=153742 RepID=A0ABD3A1E3_9GENT
MRSISGLRKGSWTEEEDALLRKCIEKHGEGKWHQVPVRAGLNRCRKSCRLRWVNYLRPDIKRGVFTSDEVDLIIRLHKLLGNRWSLIAGRLPGRTANDVKNYWNTHLQKKMGARREPEEGKAGNPNSTKMLSTSNIVKPRPRTLSKNAFWFGGKTKRNAETTIPTKRDETPKNLSPTSQLTEKDNNNMQWWDYLFLDKEGGEGTPWSIGGGSADQDHITSLWSEELSQMGLKEVDNSMHENQTGSSYFPNIDVDLWDLPNF